MKISLDECVTRHLKPYLTGHEVFTVGEMQWGGTRNDKLIALCAEHGFDILLTVDKNLQYQQNLNTCPLTIVILNSVGSKVEELIKFPPKFQEQVADLQKHRAHIIGK